MLPFSRRSHRDFARNAFATALTALRAQDAPLCDLSSGDPCTLGLGFSHAELARLLTQHDLSHYQPTPFGLRSAREALSREPVLAAMAVPAEQIMLTASTSEAYAYLFKLLCDPGDALLVPTPSYPLLEVLAALEDVTLIPYALRYDGEWHLDEASLRAALVAAQGRARAVVTVHPNNPTGSFLKRAELSSLASLGLPIISDEVFGDYAFGPAPERAESALSVADQTLVFRLAGLSKSLLAPQLKLAHTAIAGPRAQVGEACARLEHIADAYLSPSNAVQLALPSLLGERARLQAPVLTRVRASYATLQRTLAGSAASVLRVEGGWYAVLELPAVQSDEAWALALLREQGVVLQPGYFFDLPGTHVVLSLLTEEAPFAEGLARLRSSLDLL